MKPTLRYLAVGILLMASLWSMAATVTFTVGDFTYRGNNTKMTAELNGSTFTTGDLVIPGTVVNPNDGNTYTVVGVYKTNLFKGKTGITSAKLPAFTSMKTSMFYGCTGLTSVEFAEGATIVGTSTFRGCTNLKDVKLASTITKIEGTAFYQCTALTEINLPAELTEIGSQAFYKCNGLTSVVLPDKLKKMSNAFYYCEGIKSVTFGASIPASINIGQNFYKSPLEEIKVSTDNPELAAIDGILYDKRVTNLMYVPTAKVITTFTLPATVKTMSSTFSDMSALREFTCSDALESIADKSFQRCPELTTVHLGKGLKYFGYNCFERSTKMATVTLPDDNPYMKFDNGALTSADGKTLFQRFSFASGSEYTAPSALETVAPYAFSGNRSLTKITLPETVTSIGEYAFYGTSKLSEFTWPAATTVIPANCFYNGSLEKFKVPDGVTEIGDGAFYNCDLLLDITIGADVAKIGGDAFYADFWGNEAVTVYMDPEVPPTLAASDYGTFNAANTTIYVWDTCMDAYKAAEGWSAYKLAERKSPFSETVEVEQAGSLSSKIEESRLGGLTSLTVTGTINGADFEYINKMAMLTKLDISGVNVVAGGTSIVTVDNVLPTGAVASLKKLETLKLPEGLIEIADLAIGMPDESGADKVLKSVTIPSTVKKIGKGAFQSRNGLTEIILPEALETIGDNAFGYMEGLTKIICPSALKTIGNGAFTGCRGVTEISLNEGLETIGENAFMYTAPASIELPSTLTRLGERAFMNCTTLKSVKLPASVTYIENYSFAWTGLESVEIPDGVTKIGQVAFGHCDNLVSVSIPESVTEIGNSAFVMNPKLESISFPRYITSLGSAVCDRCTSLKWASVAYDLDIEGKLTLATPYDESRRPARAISLGSDGFSGCTSLEKIYIGSTVGLIGQNFVANTPNLVEVYVNCTTPPQMYDGENAFTNFDATLYVPLNSIPTYMSNRNWGSFTTVLPIEGDDHILYLNGTMSNWAEPTYAHVNSMLQLTETQKGSKVYTGTANLAQGEHSFRFWEHLDGWESATQIGSQVDESPVVAEFTEGVYQAQAVRGKGSWTINLAKRTIVFFTVDVNAMTVKFEVPNSQSSIDSVEADGAEAEYFNLQGVRITDPQPGTIVIVRRGTTVTKMLVK